MSQKKSATKLKKPTNKSLVVLFCLIIFTGTIIQLHFSSANYKEINGVSEMVYIQENSLWPISSPCYINEEEEKREKDIEILLKEIIHRESGGDPQACNVEEGCSSGMGLCQIISNTWNMALVRMKKDNIYMPDYCWQEVNSNVDKSHPIYSSECHLIVCEWLLRKDGIIHWENWSGPY